ncbi:hypothetical protein MP638_004335, partial [Amoeboaphelidium occidentale]
MNSKRTRSHFTLALKRRALAYKTNIVSAPTNLINPRVSALKNGSGIESPKTRVVSNDSANHSDSNLFPTSLVIIWVFQEEGLIEVTRVHPKYPGGSVVTINENHELWINDEKTHLLISEATIDMIKQLGLSKKFTIGMNGYVIVGNRYDVVLHTKLAKHKKDTDFLNLLEKGYAGKKSDLQVLHLDDCPYNFNVDNLQWNPHEANMIMRLSTGR